MHVYNVSVMYHPKHMVPVKSPSNLYLLIILAILDVPIDSGPSDHRTLPLKYESCVCSEVEVGTTCKTGEYYSIFPIG